jgi:hypothetical protein
MISCSVWYLIGKKRVIIENLKLDKIWQLLYMNSNMIHLHSTSLDLNSS